VVAALVALTLAALFYEVLHFRFTWILLAFLAVLSLTGQPDLALRRSESRR
jgi:hypothetical protein